MQVNEFKAFLLRGNVVDLAVAVVIGAAFANVIGAVVTGIITPLIGAIFGAEGIFVNETFAINGSEFLYGSVLDAIITFVAIAAIIFYLVVLPVNALIARSRREPPPDPTTKKCTECLSEIPIQARRCAFCASEQETAGALT